MRHAPTPGPDDRLALSALCQANLALGRADVAQPGGCAPPFLAARPAGGGAAGHRLAADGTRAMASSTTTPAWCANGPSIPRRLGEPRRLSGRPDAESGRAAPPARPPHRPVLRGGAQTTPEPRPHRRSGHQGLLQGHRRPDPPHMPPSARRGLSFPWRLVGQASPNGYHANHLHPMGWISSAFYVALPKTVATGHEAWIAFGEPGVPTSPKLPAQHFVKPVPQARALSLLHVARHRPFTGEDPASPSPST